MYQKWNKPLISRIMALPTPCSENERRRTEKVKKKDASRTGPETEHTIAIEEPSKKEHAQFHL